MKKLLALLIICSLLIVGTSQAQAQDGGDCDPEALREWLLQRQAWRNATTETVNKAVDANLSWDNVPLVLIELHRHMQTIADLPRPSCADNMLLWTYYRYDAFNAYWLCGFVHDETCQTEMDKRVIICDKQVEKALRPLLEVAGISDNEYTTLTEDLLPDGWSWPPESLRELFPAAYTEGMLDFEGTTDTVSDPVTIPEGVYRVSLETEGTGLSVEMIVLTGECYVGNSSWDTEVFSLADDGAQSLITSKECDVMWQVEYVDAPFKLTFEKMR